MKWVVEPIIPTIKMYTDASNEGFGVFIDAHWMSQPFESQYVNPNGTANIAQRECFAVVAGVIQYMDLIRHKNVELITDNDTTFNAIKNKDTHNKRVMPLIRLLYFMAVKFEFKFIINQIDTKENTIADLLSRLKINEFKVYCNQNNVPYKAMPTQAYNIQQIMKMKDE